jgi:hypothetical protein
MGPGIKPLGEVKTEGQLYQRQLATTIAALIGFDFKPKHEVMHPISSIVDPSLPSLKGERPEMRR